MSKGILEKLLSEISSDDFDEKVRMLCDQISDEERAKNEKKYDGPDGANVFLSLKVDDKKLAYKRFLTLERERPKSYVVILYQEMPGTRGAKGGTERSFKRIKAFEVTVEAYKPTKIIKKYAETLKFLLGE